MINKTSVARMILILGFLPIAKIEDRLSVMLESVVKAISRDGEEALLLSDFGTLLTKKDDLVNKDASMSQKKCIKELYENIPFDYFS